MSEALQARRCPSCGDDHLWRLNQGCYTRYMEARLATAAEELRKAKAHRAVLWSRLCRANDRIESLGGERV